MCVCDDDALRVPPAVTRLTVYRRLQVQDFKEHPKGGLGQGNFKEFPDPLCEEGF